MEYHYQWPISMEPPATETKKWDESFWGKSPRCLGNPRLPGQTSNHAPRCFSRTRSMRRRRFYPPPSNHFPRAVRHQWTPASHNFDYKWNQGVAEKPRLSSTSYDHDYDNNCCNLNSAFKKRSCPKRDKPRKLCPSSSEQYGVENESVDIDYFPIKSPQINEPEYVYQGESYSGSSFIESTANGSEVNDYSQLGLVTDIAQNYNPEAQYHHDFSRSLMSPGNDMTTGCTAMKPECEDLEKNIHNPGNYLKTPSVDGKLDFIDKETIIEFLDEMAGLSVPMSLNGSQSYEILRNDPVLGNLQGETEVAVRNLELLYPSIAFTSEQQTVRNTSEFLSAPCATPTLNHTKVVEDMNVQSSVTEYDPSLILIAQTQSSSVTSDSSSQIVSSKGEGVEQPLGSSLAETSSELLPSITSDQVVTQESITSLIQQNQLLTDFLSQVLSGTFEFEKGFVEECQMPIGTLPEASSAKLVVSPANLPKESLIQSDHPNLEIVPFKYPNLNQTVVDAMGRDEELFNIVRRKEASTITSDIYNNDSSDFDGNSCMNKLNSNDGSNHEEMTLSSVTNYIVEEPDLDFPDMSKMMSIFDTEDTEEMLSLCVAPNSILKEKKRPRKRIKKVMTNVQVKTKKIRRKQGSSVKNDFPEKDEVVRSICKTSIYTSDLESKAPIEVHCDAETQTSIEVELKKEQMDKIDVETQWTDDIIRDRTGLDDCETLKSPERIADLEKEYETDSSCRVNTDVETNTQEFPSKTFNCNPVEDSSSLKASVQKEVITIAQEDWNTPGTPLKRTMEESVIGVGAVRGWSNKPITDSGNSKNKHHNILKSKTEQEYSLKTFSCNKVEESSSLKTSVQEDVITLVQEDSMTSGTPLKMTLDEGIICIGAARGRPKKSGTDSSKTTDHNQNKCQGREVKNGVPKSNGVVGKHESPHELRLSIRPRVKSNSTNASSSPVTRSVLQAKRRQLKSDPVTQETPKLTGPGISTRSKEKRTTKEISPVFSIVLRRKRVSSSILDDPPFKRQRMRSSKSKTDSSPCENLGLRNNSCDYSTPRSSRILRKRIQCNTTV